MAVLEIGAMLVNWIMFNLLPHAVSQNQHSFSTSDALGLQEQYEELCSEEPSLTHIGADINEIVMVNSPLLAGFLRLKSADVGPKSVGTSAIVHSVEAATDAVSEERVQTRHTRASARKRGQTSRKNQ